MAINGQTKAFNINLSSFLNMQKLKERFLFYTIFPIMNERAKIMLSPLETELVTNSEWILAKRLIIQKVYNLFGRLNEDFKKIVSEKGNNLIKELQTINGKISKGENYKGLPYIILDYPAVFGKEDILAIRTLFWWGNFFSITLHVSGKYQQQIKECASLFPFLKENNFSICVNENQWEHDFSNSNFSDIELVGKEQLVNIFLKSFLKISKKTDLKEWDSAGLFLIENFKELIDLVEVSFPAGEKVL